MAPRVLAALALIAGCDAASSPATPPAAAPADGGVESGRTEDGCASGERDAGPTPAPEACPADAPRQLAFLSSGECADVAAATGTWRSRLLFPTAPDAIRTRACGYSWSSPSGAPPDRAGLLALAPAQVTSDCEPVATLERRGVVSELVKDPSDVSAGAPTGVTGCDVCGRILERQVYLILPVNPELERSVLAVETTSGSLVGFALTRPSPRAQVFSVELPDVAGRTYAPKVLVFPAP